MVWFVEQFQDKTRIENMQYLSRVAASYNTLIEAIPFTAEEYNKLDKRTFLAHIVKTGRRCLVAKSKSEKVMQ